MIFDLLAPSQGPRGRGPKKLCCCNSHTKFDWILSKGLGGDSMTHGGDFNIPIAFLKRRDKNVLKNIPDRTIFVDLCHHIVSSFNRTIITNLCDIIFLYVMAFSKCSTSPTLVECIAC